MANPNMIKGAPSVNPTGRPKDKPLTDALHKLLKRKVESANRKLYEETMYDIVAKTLIKAAVKGDVKAIREIWDRTEGKPMQELKHEGITQPVFNIEMVRFSEDGDTK